MVAASWWKGKLPKSEARRSEKRTRVQFDDGPIFDRLQMHGSVQVYYIEHLH